MMKLSKEKFNYYRKKTFDEIAFGIDENSAQFQLEDALKTLILVFVSNHPKPKNHLMEQIIIQATKNSGEWFRSVSNSEYALEPMYSQKKLKIERFLEDQINLIATRD
jgi:hypothetical protein